MESPDQNLPAQAERQYTVAKAPLRNLPAEKRAQIAQEVLQAYAAGEEIADLAPSYDVSDVTLYALLIREHETEWKQAQIGRGLARKARAYRDLDELRTQLRSSQQTNEDGEKAPHDQISLARIQHQIKLAEVQCKRAEWELERIYRRVYGQEAVTGGSALHISLNFGTNQTQGHVVDAEVVSETKT